MIIDSHQHYWTISRDDYGWLTTIHSKLYANFMPEHLKPILESLQIHKTVVVQAAPSLDEALFLLDVAEREDTIAGVVGWMDLDSDDFARQFERFRAYPKFAGIRPMIQDLPLEWLLKGRVVENCKRLAEADFPIDLQANPRHLPYILRLLEQVEGLRAVIDHLAKPPIREGIMEPWRLHMTRIADYSNVMCKMSGLVPDLADAPWQAEEIQPYADHAMTIFGTDRIMFGSDWPVCLNSASYEQVFRLFLTLIGPDMTTEQLENMLARNACRFYRLKL